MGDNKTKLFFVGCVSNIAFHSCLSCLGRKYLSLQNSEYLHSKLYLLLERQIGKIITFKAMFCKDIFINWALTKGNCPIILCRFGQQGWVGGGAVGTPNLQFLWMKMRHFLIHKQHFQPFLTHLVPILYPFQLFGKDTAVSALREGVRMFFRTKS